MFNRIQYGIGISLITALAALTVLVGWNLSLLWRIFAAALLIISIGIGVTIFWLEKKRQHERLLQAAYQYAVDTINHQRHDSMNSLQLLYGYMRLNKTEKLIHAVDHMKLQMMEDSQIARLGYPELVLYLIRQRLSGGTMPVEVSIPEAIQLSDLRLSLTAADVTELVMKGVQFLRIAPKKRDAADGIVPIRLAFIKEPDELCIRYEYDGKLLRPDDVLQQFQEMATKHGVRLEQLSKKEQSAAVYQWIMPCTAE